MLKFKPLDLEDKDLFEKYIKDYKFNTYEYSFSTLYLWRKLCNVEYAFLDNVIILKKCEKDKGSYFMQPLGYDSKQLEEIIWELKRYKESRNLASLFRDVEDGFLNELKELYGDKIIYKEDINNFDYIYDTNKLINLTGKKLHGKKNHYNQFVNMYKYEIGDISEPRVVDDCIKFASTWTETKENINNHLTHEYEGLKDILRNKQRLDIKGMAVYVDSQIIGFSIGEKINKDMAIIHIEKGDPKYKGGYAFINKTFVERYFSDTVIINREEDLGIEGLRKAKSSYHPLRLEKKYIIDDIKIENLYVRIRNTGGDYEKFICGRKC